MTRLVHVCTQRLLPAELMQFQPTVRSRARHGRSFAPSTTPRSTIFVAYSRAENSGWESALVGRGFDTRYPLLGPEIGALRGNLKPSLPCS